MSIEFDWSRDEAGYHLVEETTSSPASFARLLGLPEDSFPRHRIVRRGGQLVPSRPLEMTDNLVQIFLNSAQTEEGLLDFYARFGPLTSMAHDDRGEDVSYGMLLARFMDNLLKASPSERINKLRTYRNTPYTAVKMYQSRRGVACANAQIQLVADPVTGTPRLKFFVVQFSEALLLRFAQAIASQHDTRQCSFCGTWFDAGPGTGRRADAKFCSDQHRIAFNSQKRKRAVI